MKKLIKLFCIASILVVSCGETELNIEEKKTQLKELKSQLTDIKSQIKELQNELNGQLDDTRQKKVPVRIKELKEELFYHFIEQTGKINSDENVLVSSEMGGLITDINAKEGQWVKKGSSIIILDSEIMKSNVEELITALEFAETTFERQKVLWDKKIGSEIQYLQIKNQYESLQKKLETAENQLKKLTIKAPINGVIEEIFLNEGEFANPGRPAFRIVNPKNVFVEAEVAERYANILKVNTPVKVNFKTLGIDKEAPLSFVGQVINPENGTFKIKINLENPNGYLKPNGMASLEIQDYINENALVVPSQIVKKDMRGDYLFVNKNGKAEKTYIVVGLSQGNKSMIKSGLKIGDEVIIEGYSEIIGGSLLDIKN